MITVNDVPLLNYHTFPGGEVRVQLDLDSLNNYGEVNNYRDFHIKAKIKNSDELIALIHTIEIVNVYYGIGHIELTLNYLPYARQDRICNPGEINGLEWILNLLDSMDVNKLNILDVHNPSKINPMNYNMHITNTHVSDILLKNIPLIGNYNFIVAPDAGSANKIRQVVDRSNNIFNKNTSHGELNDIMKAFYHIEPIFFEKTRDQQTGKIEDISISTESITLLESFDVLERKNKRVLVVDDICDGGGTFLPIAHILRVEYDIKYIDLFVTHGIFSKGTVDLLNEYNNIITTDSFAESDLEDWHSTHYRGRLKVIKL